MDRCHNIATLTDESWLSPQTENTNYKQTLVRAVPSLGDWGVSYKLHQAGSDNKFRSE